MECIENSETECIENSDILYIKKADQQNKLYLSPQLQLLHILQIVKTGEETDRVEEKIPTMSQHCSNLVML